MLLTQIDKLKKYVEQIDIISFDLFDTLLLRNVLHPTDIFEIVEHRFNKSSNKIVDFKKIRINAEKQARTNSTKEEITYEDIYLEVSKHLSLDATKLKNLELEVEKEFIICNTKLKEIYDYAIKLNKKIYFISDMYLDKKFLVQLLKSLGYTKYTQIYISSDISKTKVTGNIFKHIEEIPNKKWLHIGDNFNSDYLVPKTLGLKAYYFNSIQKQKKIFKVNNITESIIRAIQINYAYINNSQNYWYNFGVQVAFPLVSQFMLWLEKNLEHKDNVYFFSRDGYMPYKLYNMMKKLNTNLPEAKYLYVSRRALLYPNLYNLSKEKVIDWLLDGGNQQGEVRIDNLLDNLNLNIENYMDYFVKNNLSVNEIITNQNKNKAKKFLLNIWTDINNSLEEENSLLKKYFYKQGLYDLEEINIVDIGWKGTTHNALQELLKIPVNGYFLGTVETTFSNIIKKRQSYLFNNGEPKQMKDKIIKSTGVYEFIFSAPHGSVIKFNKNLSPIFLDFNNYRHSEFVNELQNGVIDTFIELIKYKSYLNDIYTKNPVGERIITNFLRKKDTKDLLNFNELIMVGGIGRIGEVRKFTKLVNANDYIRNHKKIDAESERLLWKKGIYIKDRQGRLLNSEEFKCLYKKYLKRDYYNLNQKIILIKKGIKDPIKGMKWIAKKILLKV
ncbi:MAG: hypothetical protein ATN32_07365 [Candidatus Epulonipiscium fishelsonii]|nr:MAG: hypothetical protein ATN32_07365 [Epulopiscium sp. AS2M-Bin002]